MTVCMLTVKINLQFKTYLYRLYFQKNILNNKVNLPYGPQTITIAKNTQEVIKR